jgi:hypothetical protein
LIPLNFGWTALLFEWRRSTTIPPTWTIGFLVRPRSGSPPWNCFAGCIMEITRIPTDFKEFFELLNEEKVEYLLIGGYAVAYHGYPRYTADMDIWINPNPNNLESLILALRKFGFKSQPFTVETFLGKEKIFQFGVPPTRIDLITFTPGVEFEECYPKADTIQIERMKIFVIDRESLVKNKRACGRPKDIVDVEELAKQKTK